MNRNLRFKKHPKQTGLSSVGNPHQGSDIKRAGQVVGRIEPPCWSTKDNLFRVRFMIHCEEHPGWKWVQLKYRGDSDEDCRTFIKDNWESLCDKLDMRGDSD